MSVYTLLTSLKFSLVFSADWFTFGLRGGMLAFCVVTVAVYTVQTLQNIVML